MRPSLQDYGYRRRIHLDNYNRQAQAIAALDILQGFGGSMEPSAAAVHAA